ncbi:hypothetical protein VPH35_017031 [Triticum aestivum]
MLKKKYKAERARGEPSAWNFYGELDRLVGPHPLRLRRHQEAPLLRAAGTSLRPAPPPFRRQEAPVALVFAVPASAHGCAAAQLPSRGASPCRRVYPSCLDTWEI